jgi:hypothetical protein
MSGFERLDRLSLPTAREAEGDIRPLLFHDGIPASKFGSVLPIFTLNFQRARIKFTFVLGLLGDSSSW